MLTIEIEKSGYSTGTKVNKTMRKFGAQTK